MNNIKILIIEDEAIVALDIKGIVKKFGYEVTDMVADFESAIKSVKKNRPDIILSDINLNRDFIPLIFRNMDKRNNPYLLVS